MRMNEWECKCARYVITYQDYFYKHTNIWSKFVLLYMIFNNPGLSVTYILHAPMELYQVIIKRAASRLNPHKATLVVIPREGQAVLLQKNRARIYQKKICFSFGKVCQKFTSLKKFKLFRIVLATYELQNNWNLIIFCQPFWCRLCYYLNFVNRTIISAYMTLFLRKSLIWVYQSSTIFTSPGLADNQ